MFQPALSRLEATPSLLVFSFFNRLSAIRRSAGAISADYFPRRFDHDQALQASPILILLTEPRDVVRHLAAPSLDASVILFWQPIASIVMMAPLMSSVANNSGIAVISLLLSAVRTCPSVEPLAVSNDIDAFVIFSLKCRE